MSIVAGQTPASETLDADDEAEPDATALEDPDALDLDDEQAVSASAVMVTATPRTTLGLRRRDELDGLIVTVVLILIVV
jgi:hypothetical protein